MSRTAKELREEFKDISDLMPSHAVMLMEETLQALGEKENALAEIQAKYKALYDYAYNRSIRD